MTVLALSTYEDRAAGRRGVLANDDQMTPQRSDDFSTKRAFTLRDLMYVAIGIASMWGIQVTTQMGMRSDLRDLLTTFTAYKVNQDSTNTALQHAADAAAKRAELAIVNDANTAQKLEHLMGYLEGVGIKIPKGVKDEQR